jgi:hypothetical protein
MTEQEARELLSPYVDGLLDAERVKELEAVIAGSPGLQAECRKLQEENELLTEVLSPLRPSRSARLRVTEAMMEAVGDVHRHAQHVADTLPERGWRHFRLAVAFVALAAAVVLVQFKPMPPPADGSYWFAGVTLGLFLLGIVFMIAGRALAHVEARVLAMMGKRDVEPTNLEILLLEVFGFLCAATATVMFFWR